VEAAEREWLRVNQHRLKIGLTDTGQPKVDIDDWDLFDAMDDYLIEDCEEAVETRLIVSEPGHWQIVFVEPGFAMSQLERLVATI
jgi:hypothetical protein